jgi:hypothetical protein
MKRIVTAMLLVTLTTTFAATQVAPVAAKQKTDPSVALPFSAPATVNGIPAVVTGAFNITRFDASNGQLLAIGTIIATVPDGAGVRSIMTQASIPVDTTASGSPAAAASAIVAPAAVVQAAAASCGILHLELGPLDLDLLGLVVHLDRVVLDISAAPGAGNLLGNLLCAVAGLLDGTGLPVAGLLNQIADLLNQVLAAL